MARSPNYPQLSIQDALADVATIWSKRERSAMTAEEVVQVLGYKGLSGPSRSRMSAIKKYGLLDKQGKGWALSPRAVTLSVRENDSAEYIRAVRESISEVDLFADLFEEHGRSSEQMIVAHLIEEEQFTSDGAKKAVETFLAAKQLLAELGNLDIIEEEAKVDEGKIKGGEPPQLPDPPTKPEAGMKQDIYGLAEGDLTLLWPSRLSQESYEEAMDWLDLIKRKLSRAVSASPPPESTTEPND